MESSDTRWKKPWAKAEVIREEEPKEPKVDREGGEWDEAAAVCGIRMEGGRGTVAMGDVFWVAKRGTSKCQGERREKRERERRLCCVQRTERGNPMCV
jgi:hypothetical protein